MIIKMYGVAKAQSGKGYEEYLDIRESGKSVSCEKTGVVYRTWRDATKETERKNIEASREYLKSLGYTHTNTMDGERIAL